RDDVGRAREDADHAAGEGAGLGVEAVVVHGLAAAGLGLREGDGAAETLEDLDGGDAGAGVEVAGEAGDEEADVHAGSAGAGAWAWYRRMRRGVRAGRGGRPARRRRRGARGGGSSPRVRRGGGARSGGR